MAAAPAPARREDPRADRDHALSRPDGGGLAPERGRQVYLGKPTGDYRTAKSKLDVGFAFILVQSPGSGQSSGPRPYDYSPNEIDAMGLAIDWIAQQPWSNQKVGGFGVSYSGTTADLICASLRPQLKAVYPKAPDFDPFKGVARPGGVGSSEFLTRWGSYNQLSDINDPVGAVDAAMGQTLPGGAAATTGSTSACRHRGARHRSSTGCYRSTSSPVGFEICQLGKYHHLGPHRIILHRSGLHGKHV